MNLASASARSPKLKVNLGFVVYEGLLALSTSDFILVPNCHYNEAIILLPLSKKDLFFLVNFFSLETYLVQQCLNFIRDAFC